MLEELWKRTQHVTSWELLGQQCSVRLHGALIYWSHLVSQRQTDTQVEKQPFIFKNSFYLFLDVGTSDETLTPQKSTAR